MSNIKSEQIKKFLAIFAGISVLVYLGYQIYLINYSPLVTETAYIYETKNTVEARGFIVRDESYINNASNGTVVSIAADGKRVAKGDEVALVFSDEKGAKNYNDILKLEEEIKYFEIMNSKYAVGTVDAALLDEEIKRNFDTCLDFADKGNYSELIKSVDEVAANITSRQLAIGTNIDFDSKITELSNQLSVLKGNKSKYNTISAPVSGYYISVIDGYENAVNYDNVSTLSAKDVENVLTSGPGETKNAMGKIVGRFAWYIVCSVPTDSITGIEVGENIKLNFPNSSVGEVKAVVESINNGEDGKSAVIFMANEMSEEIAHLRFENIQIVKDEYSGFRVSNEAIRVVEGQKGVYVISGNRVKFRKIDIAYSEEDYSVVKESDENGYLRIYDEIIIRGKDLYDGKVVG